MIEIRHAVEFAILSGLVGFLFGQLLESSRSIKGLQRIVKDHEQRANEMVRDLSLLSTDYEKRQEHGRRILSRESTDVSGEHRRDNASVVSR